MTDDHFSPSRFNRLFKYGQLFLTRSNRFFQQNIVSCFEQRNRRLNVNLIHGSVDCNIRQLSSIRQVRCAFKAEFISHFEPFCIPLSPNRIRFGDGDDLQLIGMHFGIIGIPDATMTQANENSSNHGKPISGTHTLPLTSTRD